MKDLKKYEDIDGLNVKEQAGSLLKSFEGIDEKDLLSISAEYLKFKANSKYNFVFTGFTDFTSDNGEKIKAAKLVDVDGKEWINASRVLVGNLEKDINLPAIVRIVTRKEVKGQNGNYMDLEVFIVPGSKIK